MAKPLILKSLIGLLVVGIGTSAFSEPTKPPQTPPTGKPAGEIFGTPVSTENYYFAKRVAYMFSRPWGAADLPEDKREETIWENLILHYESFRRGITVPEEDLEKTINQFIKEDKKTFTRKSDPDAYKKWVKDLTQEDASLFENQMRYLLQIRALRDQALKEQKVTVNEEDLKREFLDEQNHVGGEMVTFDAKEEAEKFYQKVKDPKAWEAMKAKGDPPVRPVSLMTLEAYMDLWTIPREQMYAFHALPIGTVGPPMPFGTKSWAVYRLLDKRIGHLEDFPKQRESYRQQVEMKKKYESLKQWVEDLKKASHLQIFISDSKPAAAATQ